MRAAKAYIAKLKASADPDDDSGAFLSDQLQAEAREASGRALRSVAQRVSLSEDVSTSAYGDARLVRGHRLAATAAALSHDDATAYTATKCGALLQIDVETGKRCARSPCGVRSMHIALYTAYPEVSVASGSGDMVATLS